MLSALIKVTTTMMSGCALSVYDWSYASDFNVIFNLWFRRFYVITLLVMSGHAVTVLAWPRLAGDPAVKTPTHEKRGTCGVCEYILGSVGLVQWWGWLQMYQAVPPQQCTSTGAQVPPPVCRTPGSRGSTCTPKNSPWLPGNTKWKTLH